MKKTKKVISIMLALLMAVSCLGQIAAYANDIFYSVTFIDENGDMLDPTVYSVKRGSTIDRDLIPALPTAEDGNIYISDGSTSHVSYSWDADPATTVINANTVFTRQKTSEKHDYDFAKPQFTFKPDSKNGLAAVYTCSKCGSVGELGVKFNNISSAGLNVTLDGSALGGEGATFSHTLTADDLKTAVELAEKLGAPVTVTGPLKTAITVLDKAGDVISKITEATSTCSKEGHLYAACKDGTPLYNWNKDHSECTLKMECQRSDCAVNYNNHYYEKKMKVVGPDYTYADCTNDGIEKYSASVKFTETNLGATEDGNIDFETEYSQVWQKAEGHKLSNAVYNNDATCQHNGTYSQVCSRCGKTLSGEIDNSILDHIKSAPITVEYTEPTCTQPGSRTVKYVCTMCGEEKWERETTPIPATNHEWSDVTVENYVVPSCEEGGSYERVRYCNKCNERDVVETVNVEAKSHTPGEAEKIAVDNSTCTSGGTYKLVTKCKDCGKVLNEQTVQGENAAHNNEVTIENPSCEADGKRIFTCKNCGNRYEEIINALGHDEVYSEKEKVAPTCSEKGYTVYECTKCGDSYKEYDEESQLTDHDWDDGKVNSEPSCEGVGEKVFTCKDCGITRTEPLKKLGHDYKARVVNPSCTQYGYTVHECTRCTSSYKDNERAPKGHTEANPVKENENPASCTEEGSYDEVVYCADCNTELRRQTITVKKLPHNVNMKYHTSTCTVQGYTEYTCKDCKEEYIGTFLPCKEHTKNVLSEEIPAECEKAGKKAKIECSVCHTVIQNDDVIPATGHTEVTDAAVPADCTHAGSTEGVHCAVCEKVIKEKEIIPAKGHSLVTDKAVAPTFDKAGKTAGRHCSACGLVVTKQNAVAKLVPYATKLSKLTGAKKKITVKWAKQTRNTTGYEIQFATDKSFKKNKKLVTVSSNKTTKKAVKGLKAKKKYFVRIRTFKTVGKKKYYSSWSGAKTVKTK